MATQRKVAPVNPAEIAKDVRRRLGQTRTKLTRALEKLAESVRDEKPIEVRTTTAGRTSITFVNRGGVAVGGRTRKRSTGDR